MTLPSPNWIAKAGKPVPDGPPPAGFDFDRWLGPAPLRPYNKNRVHYLFRFYWDYSGGQQTNFGAHHLDVAQWGLGMDDSGPVSVEGTGVYNPDGWYETPDTTEIRYTYANGVVLTCPPEARHEEPRPGDRVRGRQGKPVRLPRRHRHDAEGAAQGRGAAEDRPARRRTSSHVNNFFDCVKSRQAPAADIAIGHRSATVCHLGNIAVRTGKKIAWDPKAEAIVGDADAAKWLTKEYRKPYQLG